MTKKSVLLQLACFFHVFQLLQAQIVQVAQSEIFDEPQHGEIKLIQLRNGNSVFYLQDSKAISLQLFDENHKKLADMKIEPVFGLKEATLNNLFCVEDDLAIFFSKVDKSDVKVYRLLIDGQTGNIKEEKLVEEFKKVSRYAGLNFKFSYAYVNCHALYVAKDNYSDHYAIVKLNVQEEDKNKRVEIILFGGDHREISRSYYSSPIDNYKFTRCVDMVMFQQDKVALLMCGFNTQRSGGEETASYIAVFSRERGITNVTDLKFEKDKYLQYGSIQYNSFTKELVALTLGQNVENPGTYGLPQVRFMSDIIVCDPGTGKIIRQNPVTVTTQAEQTLKDMFGNKTNYRLVPQNLSINDDGSYTVLFEDFGYFIPPNNGYISSATGNLIMSRYTAELQLKQSYLLPKSHWFEIETLQPLYVRDWARSTISVEHSNAFKSFSYLNTSFSDYVFFNDIKENSTTVLKGQLTTIKGISQSDAFVYRPTGDTVLPARDFLFKNTNANNHQLLFTPVSIYDKQKNLFITIKLVKGKNEGASIIWLSPQ